MWEKQRAAKWAGGGHTEAEGSWPGLARGSGEEEVLDPLRGEGTLVQRPRDESGARCRILMLSAGGRRGRGHAKEPGLIWEARKKD